MCMWLYIQSGYSAIDKIKFKINGEVYELIKYKHRG